jgi:hypothetical protein
VGCGTEERRQSAASVDTASDSSRLSYTTFTSSLSHRTKEERLMLDIEVTVL